MKDKRSLIILILIAALLPILLAGCSSTQYVISFDSRGGSEVKEKITINATQKKADFPTPTKEGYNFDGWYTDIYCTMPATLTNIRQNAVQELTLYAKWVGKDNILKFNSGGGWGDMDSLTVPSGDALVLPDNTFGKPGYTFAGWATAPGGEVEYINGSGYTMGTGGEYTLYAIWDFDYNYYTMEYFEGKIELLASLFGIENIDLAEYIIDDPQAISEYMDRLFGEHEIASSYIDFVVDWKPSSIVFSLEEQVYVEGFKEIVDNSLQELMELIEDDTITVTSEARGNLLCLTMGQGLNLLVNEIEKEDNVAYLLADEKASLLHFGSNKTTFTIPLDFKGREVTAIESGAFVGNQTLNTVIIPTNIAYIGSNAFGDNPALTIKCKVAAQPQDWDQNWNADEAAVIWGYSA